MSQCKLLCRNYVFNARGFYDFSVYIYIYMFKFIVTWDLAADNNLHAVLVSYRQGLIILRMKPTIFFRRFLKCKRVVL